MIEDKDVYSVGELLRIRRGDERWHLALVQRDEVWDVDRMRRLVDSLLAGYPIGALLLCRTRADSQIITRESGISKVSASVPDAWQLLDGQQRINALYSSLTPGDAEHERYGRFFLDLTADRPAPNPEAGRSDRLLQHIKWRSLTDLPVGQGVDDFPERSNYIDLSRVYEAGQAGVFEDAQDWTVESAIDAATQIDPRFAMGQGNAAAVARDWMRRLAGVWREPRVPVMKAEVQAPEDLLELFARLNRSGIPFHDADIYFAAVKTFWPHAEPSLRRVIDAATYAGATEVPLIDMMGALRLVSRVAARSLGRGDVIPLRVGRIAGTGRAALVERMGQLTRRGSTFLDNLERFTAEFGRETSLGYGVRSVRDQLWDDVLGWASVRGRWDAEDLRRIDGYLVGATIFGYPTIFGTAFSTLSFVEALTAACEDDAFPAQQIAGVTRARYPELRRSNRQIPRLVPEDDASDRERVRLADNNTSFLLSLAQRIPIDHRRAMDVDHIYASALSARMRGSHPRSHHPDRWRVNGVGNKWLLDFSLNRSLQDKAPRPKFERLLSELELIANDEASLAGSEVWARDQWAIEPEEVDLFREVDELLDTDVNRAMTVFSSLTASRSTRLVKHAMDSFPLAQTFAADHEPAEPPVEPTEFSGRIAELIATRLELPQEEVAGASTQGRDADASTAAGSEQSDDDGIAWAMKDATRRLVLQMHLDERANPTQTRNRATRHGFTYVRWVRIGVPVASTHIGVGGPVTASARAVSPLWLLVHAQTPGYDVAVERLRRLFGELVEDETGARLPLRLDRELRWSELSNQVLSRLREIVAAMTSPAE